MTLPIRKQTARRRGTAVYVSVLGVAFMVAVIGLCAMQVARLELRGVVDDNDLEEARLLAIAAIERGAASINADPNWRSNYAPNDYYSAPLGRGTCHWKLVDDDGDLTDDETDPVRIYGYGQVGRASYSSSALSFPNWPPLTCLETALSAGDNISFGLAVVTCNQTISANNSTSASGTVTADVEAVNAINGGVYIGSTTTGIAPRDMPESTVFDYYLANGSAIDINTLPVQGAFRDIIDAVISPDLNPYGATNSQGIYIIDCQGQKLRIRFSRIIGTLVVINADPGSQLAGGINWSPAVANYPALLVSGSFQINTPTLDGLSELLRLKNFNPTGAPYMGSTDSDMLDVFPARIRGLVYVSDSLITSQSPDFDGVVVAGNDVTTSGTLNLTYQSTFLDDPPPGFLRTVPDMWLEPGSWRREQSP